MKIFNLQVGGEVKYIGMEEGDLLLIRWTIFKTAAWAIYLHKFLRSDYDRALHDHPWPFVSLILWPGYVEEHDQTKGREKVKVFNWPGRMIYRPAEWRHRVILQDKRPSWSLVLVGRRRRKWGFWLPDGWCFWRRHNPRLGICEDRDIWNGGTD